MLFILKSLSVPLINSSIGTTMANIQNTKTQLLSRFSAHNKKYFK